MKMKYLILLTTTVFTQSAFAKLTGNFVPGEILVKYKSTMSTSAQKNAVEREGVTTIGKIYKNAPLRVKLTKDHDMENAILEFSNDPNVEYAQPNYIYHATALPNDPRFAQTWGLRNTGQTIVSAGGPNSPSSTNNPGTSGLDMKMEYAWNTITDCRSVTVAVLDTGINYNHQDLAANMWADGSSNHGYDFVDNDSDPMDLDGHGTHVAGTIGAVGNNGLGGTGVCWRASLMGVRVLDTTGSGTTAQITSGLNYAVANGAKVINLSLGGGNVDPAFSAAIDNARNNGAILVIAAGNETNNNDVSPAYPCSYTQSNIICVAALTQTYAKASFSNWGATSVDVGAPGVNIVSAWPGTVANLNTSMTSGWNLATYTGSRWDYTTLNLTDGTALNILAVPHNYSFGSTTKYASNSNSQMWRSFNLAGVDAAVLNFGLVADIQSGADYLNIFAQAGTSNPTGTGVKLEGISGSTGSSIEDMTYDLTAYKGSNMSLAFQLTSDASVVGNGAAILDLSLTTLTLNNSTYNVISGTSMATPKVAGLTAMIMAYNPNYLMDDVINSIKNGGVNTASLSGITTTGKAVSGVGSLNYIATPTGGSAVIVP